MYGILSRIALRRSLKVGPSQLVKLDDPCALSLRTRCVLHEPPM